MIVPTALRRLHRSRKLVTRQRAIYNERAIRMLLKLYLPGACKLRAILREIAARPFLIPQPLNLTGSARDDLYKLLIRNALQRNIRS